MEREGTVLGEPSSPVDRLARAVIGAAIEVHRHLGPGYPESVYAKALQVELDARGIPYEPEAAIAVSYKGRLVGEGRIDLLIGGELIVELKAVEMLSAIHLAQMMSYLKGTGKRLGLIINFNVLMLKDGVRRVVLS